RPSRCTWLPVWRTPSAVRWAVRSRLVGVDQLPNHHALVWRIDLEDNVGTVGQQQIALPFGPNHEDIVCTGFDDVGYNSESTSLFIEGFETNQLVKVKLAFLERPGIAACDPHALPAQQVALLFHGHTGQPDQRHAGVKTHALQTPWLGLV